LISRKITVVLILLIFCICSLGTGCIEFKGKSGSSDYFMEESVTLTKEHLISLGNGELEYIAVDEYGNIFCYESYRTNYNSFDVSLYIFFNNMLIEEIVDVRLTDDNEAVFNLYADNKNFKITRNALDDTFNVSSGKLPLFQFTYDINEYFNETESRDEPATVSINGSVYLIGDLDYVTTIDELQPDVYYPFFKNGYDINDGLIFINGNGKVYQTIRYYDSRNQTYPIELMPYFYYSTLGLNQFDWEYWFEHRDEFY